MSIVTFVNDDLSQVGKTMSLVDIATDIAIDNNMKILVISTTNKFDDIETCFWQEKKKEKNLSIFGKNVNLDTENGIKSLERVVRSNKLLPELITNYAKTVFKERLEFLLGTENENNTAQDIYPEIIARANEYYDIVFVDLDSNIDEEYKEQILEMSNVNVYVINQKIKMVNQVYEKFETLDKKQKQKNIVVVAKYDKHSKYNAKNMGRYLNLKEPILNVPYNTLFFEAIEEANVASIFLNWKRNLDNNDRNAIFLKEIKLCSNKILKKIETLRLR